MPGLGIGIGLRDGGPVGNVAADLVAAMSHHWGLDENDVSNASFAADPHEFSEGVSLAESYPAVDSAPAATPDVEPADAPAAVSTLGVHWADFPGPYASAKGLKVTADASFRFAQNDWSAVIVVSPAAGALVGGQKTPILSMWGVGLDAAEIRAEYTATAQQWDVLYYNTSDAVVTASVADATLGADDIRAIVIVHDNTASTFTISVYDDAGTLIGTDTQTDAKRLTTGTDLEIGMVSSLTRSWLGLIGEVQIYKDHVLTEDEIAYIINSGAFKSYWNLKAEAQAHTRTAFWMGNSISFRAGFQPTDDAASSGEFSTFASAIGQTFTNGHHFKLGNPIQYMERFPYESWQAGSYYTGAVYPAPWPETLAYSTYSNLAFATFESGEVTGLSGEGRAIDSIFGEASGTPNLIVVAVFLQQTDSRFATWNDTDNTYEVHWNDSTTPGTNYWLNKSSNINLMAALRDTYGLSPILVPLGDFHKEFDRIALSGGVVDSSGSYYSVDLTGNGAAAPYKRTSDLGSSPGIYYYVNHGGQLLVVDANHQTNVGSYIYALGAAKALYSIDVTTLDTLGQSVYQPGENIAGTVLQGTTLESTLGGICQEIVERVMDANPYNSSFYADTDDDPHCWFTFDEAIDKPRLDSWNGKQLFDHYYVFVGAESGVPKATGPATGVDAVTVGNDGGASDERGLIGRGIDFNVPSDVNGAFTVMITAKNFAGPPGNNNTLVARASLPSATHHLWSLRTKSDGDLNFLVYTSSGLQQDTTTTTPFADTNWHRIICVYDTAEANEMKIYVDSTTALREVSKVGTLLVQPDVPLTVGFWQENIFQSPWDGDVTNLVLLDRAPTTAEIAEYMDGTDLVETSDDHQYPLINRRVLSPYDTLKGKLVSVYEFLGDDSDSYATYDLAPGTAPTYRTENNGYGADFEDTSSQYLRYTGSEHGGGTDGLYVAAVITPESVGTSERFIAARWDAGGTEWKLSFTTGGNIKFQINDGGPKTAQTVSAISAGNSYLVEGWYDPTLKKIVCAFRETATGNDWTDGANQAETAITTGITGSGATYLSVARQDNTADKYYDGIIHSLWISQRHPGIKQRQWLWEGAWPLGAVSGGTSVNDARGRRVSQLSS